jgi:hypothetical protein
MVKVASIAYQKNHALHVTNETVVFKYGQDGLVQTEWNSTVCVPIPITGVIAVVKLLMLVYVTETMEVSLLTPLIAPLHQVLITARVPQI